MSSIALALAAGCNSGDVARPEEAPLVRVLAVTAASGPAAIEYPGEVRARHEAPLSFRVGGKLVELAVVAGSRVRKGALLARLDPADLLLAVRTAESLVASAAAERDLAEVELRRFRELREKNYISTAEFERRETAYATARSRLEAAQSQLRQAANQAEYASLRADTDGVILGTDAEPGQVVAAGQRVMRLARPGELEVAIAVPEAQHEAFRRSGELAVRVNALGARPLRGRLREIAPAADSVTRTYAARVSIVEAPPAIELGMSARVAIQAPAGPGVELPLNAIHSRGEGEKVWVVDAAGVVRAVPVTLRAVSAERVIVESALAPGERVVVAGAQLLRAGQRVRILADDPQR